MCWSLEASAAVTLVGAATTAVAITRKQSPAIWLTLGYFTAMEVLQAATYVVVDLCGIALNKLLTVLSYVHIAGQPFFINLISMYFIPDKLRRQIAPAVYVLCSASAIYMLAQLYAPSWLEPCVQGDVLCGTRLCAVTGTWHIGWEIPYQTADTSIPFPSYLLVGFLLPVLYGSWRITLFHFLTGPAAAYASTSDSNEWPAVWCLYSVGLLLIALVTPLRQRLFVRSWYSFGGREKPLPVSSGQS